MPSFYDIFVAGCTGSCHFDNFRYSQRRKCRPNGVISFQCHYNGVRIQSLTCTVWMSLFLCSISSMTSLYNLKRSTWSPVCGSSLFPANAIWILLDLGTTSVVFCFPVGLPADGPTGGTLLSFVDASVESIWPRLGTRPDNNASNNSVRVMVAINFLSVLWCQDTEASDGCHGNDVMIDQWMVMVLLVNPLLHYWLSHIDDINRLYKLRVHHNIFISCQLD